LGANLLLPGKESDMARSSKPGGSGTASIKGDRRDNLLVGTDNGESIFGYQGNDTLVGNGGNDFLYGDDGNDSLSGGSGNDRLYGNAGNDSINGGADADVIFAGAGSDAVLGGDGNDELLGGTGSDYFDGGAGIDIVSFEDVNGGSGDAGVSVVATYDGVSTTYSVTAGTDVDTVVNVEQVRGSNFNDTMTGGAGDDYLVGLWGDDTISGGGGNDTLYGSVEADYLTGGAGADTFVFLNQADGRLDTNDPGAGDGLDTIADFVLGEDRILLISNEDFDFVVQIVGANTIITYDTLNDLLYGPSSITLLGVNYTRENLSGSIEKQVEPDFNFLI
jgi:Ca2+-binding RTX toxin-like protein